LSLKVAEKNGISKVVCEQYKVALVIEIRLLPGHLQLEEKRKRKRSGR
jgi:hypothetical protein